VGDETGARGFALRLLLTDRCNLRCSFCHNEFQGNAKRGATPTFNIALLDSIVAKARDEAIAEPLSLKLSGGEPTLYLDRCVDLLRWGTSHALDRRILLSNLARELDSADVANLRTSGLTEVRVNIPSAKPDTYAAITGISLGRARKATEIVRSNMQRLSDAGIAVQVNRVLASVQATSELVEDMSELALWGVSHFRFIADDRQRGWSVPELTRLENDLAIQAPSVASHEFTVCRQLDSESTDDDRHDWYITPPGKRLTIFERGRAYQLPSESIYEPA
jgi:molybdenum cofactor biosynthesis enzyme MoaA